MLRRMDRRMDLSGVQRRRICSHCSASGTETMRHRAARADHGAEILLDLSGTMPCDADGFRGFNRFELNDIAGTELRQRVEVG